MQGCNSVWDIQQQQFCSGDVGILGSQMLSCLTFKDTRFSAWSILEVLAAKLHFSLKSANILDTKMQNSMKMQPSLVHKRINRRHRQYSLTDRG